MHLTTLNIHPEIFKKISGAADKLQKSRRALIVSLLMRLMKDNNRFMGGFKTVKYQPDNKIGKWHCYHISFKQDEYEFFLDLRKLCKCSVSFLLAIAVDCYLDECSQKIKKNMDKYPIFNNYVLRQDVLNGIICWHTYWGFPKRHLQTIRI